nr:Os04g0641250 [Ipomoea trifida]
MDRIGTKKLLQRLKRKFAAPRRPSLGIDQVADLRFHDDRSRIFLPWPPQIALEFRLVGDEVIVRHDLAVLQHDSGGLALVRPSLRRHGVLLLRQRLPHHHLAVLENRRRVSEYEVDGAGDVASSVELPRHRLALLRPRCVLESDGLCLEPFSQNS